MYELLNTIAFFSLECVEAAAESAREGIEEGIGPFYNFAEYSIRKGECSFRCEHSGKWHDRQLETTVNGTKVWVRTGSEGPKYDPYSFTEITVERLSQRVTLHSGLAVWIEFENPIEYARQHLTGERYEDGGAAIFEALTGYSPSQWMEWHERARYRCRHCGNQKKFRYGGGYVGETVTFCGVCGAIVCDDFHPSMIE